MTELNLIERLAIWILKKSHRIGLLVVKGTHSNSVLYSVHKDDSLACMLARDIQYATAAAALTQETHAHVLERIYHQPSYGERE